MLPLGEELGGSGSGVRSEDLTIYSRSPFWFQTSKASLNSSFSNGCESCESLREEMAIQEEEINQCRKEDLNPWKGICSLTHYNGILSEDWTSSRYLCNFSFGASKGLEGCTESSCAKNLICTYTLSAFRKEDLKRACNSSFGKQKIWS